MGLASSKISTLKLTNPKAQTLATVDVVDQLNASDADYKRRNKEQDQNDSASDPAILVLQSPEALKVDTTEMRDSSSAAEATKAVDVPNRFPGKLLELEEIDFHKTFERINKFFSAKPQEEAKSAAGHFELLQQRVINCYREYCQEPLKCSIIAQQYHNYIFNKHFENLLNKRERKVVEKEEEGQDKK